MARLAERAGDPATAAAALREILAAEPTHREALAAGARIFAADGDAAGAGAARDALEDLGSREGAGAAGRTAAAVPGAGAGDLDGVLAALVSAAT